MLDINEIKKDLYKSKNMAKFSHYQSGNLFYTVDIAEGKYQFPIPVVETKSETILVAETQKDENGDDKLVAVPKIFLSLSLSEDLGITPFEAEVRGSELIRWIQKAMNKFEGSEFIKVG